MPILPASDLRSEAKEYQRDRNHNAKWARGTAPAQGRRCSHVDMFDDNACPDCARRPQHRDADRRAGRHFSELKHAWNKKNTGQKVTMARKVFRNEVVDATDGSLANVSDSSGEEEVIDTSAAPVLDADVMYSFDAARGPGKGNDILSHAINRAVQRYEHKETEKLVKEYDLVEDCKDTGEGYAADDDDYEMIDHSHLN